MNDQLRFKLEQAEIEIKSKRFLADELVELRNTVMHK